MATTTRQRSWLPAAAGGFGVVPAQMRHYFLARTASTFQVHGIGPFTVNYVNPADDPSRK